MTLVVHLPAHSRRLAALTATVARTTSHTRADSSPWTWSADDVTETRTPDRVVRVDGTWTLTPLGILHTLTGLTICTTPKDQTGHHPPCPYAPCSDDPEEHLP